MQCSPPSRTSLLRDGKGARSRASVTRPPAPSAQPPVNRGWRRPIGQKRARAEREAMRECTEPGPCTGRASGNKHRGISRTIAPGLLAKGWGQLLCQCHRGPAPARRQADAPGSASARSARSRGQISRSALRRAGQIAACTEHRAMHAGAASGKLHLAISRATRSMASGP